MAELRDSKAIAASVASLITLDTYRETLGAWIEEIYTSSLDDISSAKTDSDLYKAQGRFQAIHSLLTRIKETIQAGNEE